MKRHEHTVAVSINGMRVNVDAHRPLSFDDVAHVAGFTGTPSMTLRQPGLEGRILHSGDSVMAVDGMIFNVADTSNA